MAWKILGAASLGERRCGGSLERSTNTCSMTVRRGTSIEVTYSGKASVHQSSDTNAKSARQFCFSGSEKIGRTATHNHCGAIECSEVVMS